jgi:Fe-Mn family superoxide dismutase
MWIEFDLNMVKYELPRLPYAYDALEPFLDKQTMEIHHQKYHQAYADGLNKTLEQISGEFHPQYITSILSDLSTVPESMRNSIIFLGGGFENHKLFWETMTPKSDKNPGGKLEDSIDVYFDNFGNLKKQFSDKALSVQGSGWCWLVFNPTFNKIEIMTTANQDSPWTVRRIPLLGLDLWEHAYYLKYQNKRLDYVESWWNVINWDYVNNRFSELSD